MKYYYLLFFTIISSKLYSQTTDFYDPNVIQTIEINFNQSNWDYLMDLEMNNDQNYIEAQSVSINGQVFNQVGVKYKGNSSYNANQIKNPFHIELDTYIDQDFQGFTDIKLSNGHLDPSFIRETLSYNILRNYMHAPKANYANLYINGDLIGLYTNVESVSKKFVKSRFGSKNNAFFKCSPPGGAGPQASGLPSLEYLGNNISSYVDAYEIKSEDDDDISLGDIHWTELINLTNILNNNINNIESVLDVDRAIWMLAFNNLLVNLDSYIGLFQQNYYLYKNDSGLFNSIVWDLNESFGTFAMTGQSGGGPGGGGPGGGGPGGGGNLNNTVQKAEMDHLLHLDDDNFPLVSKLLNIPHYKKKYLAHYKTILNEAISNSNYIDIANQYRALINSSVIADSNKFYTHNQFLENLNSDITSGQRQISGLTNLMGLRENYLNTLSDFNVVQPQISNVTILNQNPEIGDNITINALISNTNSDGVYLGYRTEINSPFIKIPMFDDGIHNDGGPGDNVYGANLTIGDIETQYYVYAENNTIGAFLPQRAEHEFFNLLASYSTISAGDLVVNEIMASNSITSADQNGEFDDWIELYNISDQEISLDNLYLSDDPANKTKWRFPDGIIMEPNSYKIVWCDDDEDQDGLHTSFKLSSSGEDVVLSYPNGDVLEQFNFGPQVEDLGYARVPNGSGSFIIQEATFNANNEAAMHSNEFDENLNLSIYPNPAEKDYVTIQTSFGDIKKIQVFDITGKELINKLIYTNQLNISGLSSGVYLIKVKIDDKVQFSKIVIR